MCLPWSSSLLSSAFSLILNTPGWLKDLESSKSQVPFSVEGRREGGVKWGREGAEEGHVSESACFYISRSTCFSVEMGGNALEWRPGNAHVLSPQQRRRRPLHNPGADGRVL